MITFIYYLYALFCRLGQTHPLAICTLVKPADVPYVLEWVEFHLEQGVSHFNLYYDSINLTSVDRFSLHKLHTFERFALARSSGRKPSVVNESHKQSSRSMRSKNESIVHVHPSSTLKSLYSVRLSVRENIFDLLFHRITSDALHTLTIKAIYDHCRSAYPLPFVILRISVQEFLYSNSRSLNYIDYIESSCASVYHYGFSGTIWPYENLYLTNRLYGNYELRYDPRESILYQLLSYLSIHERKLNLQNLRLITNYFNALQFKLLACMAENSQFYQFNEYDKIVLFESQTMEATRNCSNNVYNLSKLFLSLSNFTDSDAQEILTLLTIFEDQFTSKNIIQVPFGKNQNTTTNDELLTILRLLESLCDQPLLLTDLGFQNLCRLPHFIDHKNPPSRAELHHGLVASSSLFYPLVVFNQLNRSPTYTEVKFYRQQLQTLCHECLTTLESYLEKHSYAYFVLQAPDGHSVFRQQAEANHKVCTPISDLRLDRHHNRSLYTTEPQQQVSSKHLLFSSIVRDTSKIKFVDRLVKRLSAYSPTYVLYNYTKTKGPDATVIKTFVFRTCTLLGLLGLREIMCPPSHPYVGYLSYNPGYTTTHLPYDFCVSEQRLVNPSFASQENLKKYMESAIDKHSAMDELIIDCPGLGMLPCCDYNRIYANFSVHLNFK